MKLNAAKTKRIVIYFGKSKINVPIRTIEGEPIECIHHSKLLRITLSENLDWDDQRHQHPQESKCDSLSVLPLVPRTFLEYSLL